MDARFYRWGNTVKEIQSQRDKDRVQTAVSAVKGNIKFATRKGDKVIQGKVVDRDPEGQRCLLKCGRYLVWVKWSQVFEAMGKPLGRLQRVPG